MMAINLFKKKDVKVILGGLTNIQSDLEKRQDELSEAIAKNNADFTKAVTEKDEELARLKKEYIANCEAVEVKCRETKSKIILEEAELRQEITIVNKALNGLNLIL